MDFRGRITDPKAALQYALAGKAFFTLVSLKSGNRYTYKVELADKRNPNDTDVWFVSLLNGPDNWTNYAYIGMIRQCEHGTYSFRWTGKSRVSQDAPSFVGFEYCFEGLVNSNMDGFEFIHEGKCGRCGRRLTVPDSVESGFGPECIGKVGVAAALNAPVAASGAPAPQANLNFDGSKRQPRKAAVKVSGTPAPVSSAPNVANVGNIDAEIRRRIQEYKAEGPENYYHDGELDEKQAFAVAYNKFRREIEAESQS